MSAAFDTLRLARTLRDKAKFSPEQAEGLADAFAEVMQGDIATKADILASETHLDAEIHSTRVDLAAEIKALRIELKTEIQSVRSDLRQTELRLEAKIESTKSDLIKWVVGMIGFQTIVLLGAALALARVFTK